MILSEPHAESVGAELGCGHGRAAVALRAGTPAVHVSAPDPVRRRAAEHRDGEIRRFRLRGLKSLVRGRSRPN